MRKIIDYIRSLFCKHDFELLDKGDVYEGYGPYTPPYPSYTKWIYVCKKCGYKKKITSK